MPRWAAALVFLITLAVYISALCPSPYWLDSSEFAVASFVLGVAHPPGHPLAVLLGQAALLLPLGPAAFRVGLVQALCAALSAALLCLVGAALCARARAVLAGAHDEAPAPPALIDVLTGAGFALGTSLSYAVTFQAVRPEVYALHRLLAAGALLGLCRYDERGDARQLGLFALCAGLGLANHHYLMLLLLLPLPVLLLLRGDGRMWRAAGLCAAFLLVGLLFYVYLPLRGAHHTLVNWGAPTTLQRLLWVVSARAFHKSVKPPEGGDEDVLPAVLDMVGPAGLLFGSCGLYLLLRQRPTRRLGAYLLFLVALYAGGRAVLGFDPANPDAHGYLILGGDAVALLACAGVGGMITVLWRLAGGRISGRAWPALCGALLLADAGWGAASYRRSDRSRFFDLDTFMGAWLDEAPPRGRLFSTHFQSLFALWYLQGVEGRRPDVEHLHPHFLGNPGYREDQLLRFPGSPDLPEVLGERGVRPEALLRSAARRPTLYEFDLDTPPALVPALHPYGLAEAVLPGLPPDRRGALGTGAQRRRQQLQSRLDLGEPESRRVILWRSFVRAVLACQQGDRPGYQAERARARQLLTGGRSPELDELERGCAALSPPR